MVYLSVLLLLHSSQGAIPDTKQQQMWQYAQTLVSVSGLPQPSVEIKELQNVFGLADKDRRKIKVQREK